MNDKKLPSKKALIEQGWAQSKESRAAFIIALILVAIVNILYFGATALLSSKLGLGDLIKFILEIPGDYILPPLFGGGLAAMALAASRDQATDFKDVLSQAPHWKKYAITYVLMVVLLIIGFICLILPGIYLTFCYYFVYFLMADTGLSGWQALEVSRKIVTPHWFYVGTFALLLGILNMVGALCLLIGLFWTVPATFVATALLYRQLFTEEAIAEALAEKPVAEDSKPALSVE